MKDNVSKENRKALPKFFLIIVVSAICGGMMGFLAGFAGHAGLAEAAAQGVNGFLRTISPWAIPVLTVVLMGAGLRLYFNAKRSFEGWDGEDDAAMDQADRTLSWCLLLSTLLLIFDFFFLAVSTSGVFQSGDLSPICIVAAFLLSCALVTIFQQKIVDLTKRMNPEKHGSVYDMKFHKKWFESCDEAERRQIGQAAYKAFRVTGTACIFIWLALVIGNIVFDFGLVPIFVSLLIWGFLQISYTLECIRLDKRK
ncbi:DUF3169 family protein [Dysosmobacter sp.]